MREQMNLNRSVEQVIQDFARRSGLEEAERFSQIFQIAKRSGGQLTPVICHTVSIMEDKSQVKEEIRTMSASVQFEQKVMMVIPFLMILYIDATSPGFFAVMYETVFGRLVMSGCLAMYLLSCYLSRKILDIPIG
jgi:tight adherence protein B